MELRNKSVKRENDEQKGKNKLKWKNLPRSTKRGVIAMGVIIGLSFAAVPLIDHYSKRELEKKKGELVAENTDCGDMAVSGLLSTVLLEKHQILVDPCYLLEDPSINEKSGVITVKNVTLEEFSGLVRNILNTINDFWKNAPMESADGPMHFKGSISKLEYEDNILKITLGVTVVEAEKPKTKKVEVFMSELEVPEDKIETKTVTKTVKVGNTIPYIEEDTENEEPVDVSLKVTKVNEKEVELAWEAETAFEEGYFEHPMVVPYGKTIRRGEGILFLEIKAEKGKNPGEAVVTVKTPVISDSEKTKTVEVPEDPWALVEEEGTESEKTKTVEVFMSEVELPEKLELDPEMRTVKKKVKEGDEVPMLSGTNFRHMHTAKVTKIDEKGIEVAWIIKSAFEMDAGMNYSVKVPYGESRKTGEGALTWEVKAEKGKKAGEAIVTVKYPDFSE